MNLTKIGYAIVFGVGLASISHAQITKVGSGYKFRVNYQKGQVLRFSTVSGVDNKGNSAAGTTVKVPITLVVLDKKKGNSSIKLTMGAMKVGSTVVQPEQSTLVNLDSRNRGASDQKQNIGTTLPENAIQIGTSWHDSRPFNIGGSMAVLNGVYRFQGLKNSNGNQVAVITYQLSGFAQGSGTMTLLVKDGTLYTNDFKLSMTGGERSLIRIFSKMTRS